MSMLDFLRPSYWTSTPEATCTVTDTLCRVTDAAGVGPYHLPQTLQNGLQAIDSVTRGYVSPATASVAIPAIALSLTVLTIRQLRTDVAKLVKKDMYDAIKGDEKLLQMFKVMEQDKETLAAIKGLTTTEAQDFAKVMKDKAEAEKFLQFAPKQRKVVVDGFKKKLPVAVAEVKEQQGKSAKERLEAIRKAREDAKKKTDGSKTDAKTDAKIDAPAAEQQSYLAYRLGKSFLSYFNPWAYGKKAAPVVNPVVENKDKAKVAPK